MLSAQETDFCPHCNVHARFETVDIPGLGNTGRIRLLTRKNNIAMAFDLTCLGMSSMRTDHSSSTKNRSVFVKPGQPLQMVKHFTLARLSNPSHTERSGDRSAKFGSRFP